MIFTRPKADTVQWNDMARKQEWVTWGIVQSGEGDYWGLSFGEETRNVDSI